jgi:hypothetical protein
MRVPGNGAAYSAKLNIVTVHDLRTDSSGYPRNSLTTM